MLNSDNEYIDALLTRRSSLVGSQAAWDVSTPDTFFCENLVLKISYDNSSSSSDLRRAVIN